MLCVCLTLCHQVVKGSEDHPSQYMNFMNVVFTCQKLGIVIDACILDNESGLLQQASSVTGCC
jgi:transcription initiation factor TFIIH subunit 3